MSSFLLGFVLGAVCFKYYKDKSAEYKEETEVKEPSAEDAAEAAKSGATSV